MTVDGDKKNTDTIFVKPDNTIKKVFKNILPIYLVNSLLKLKLTYLDKYIDYILYKVIKNFFLKFSHPVYKKIPVKHSSCLYSLNQFLSKTKNFDYDFFLTAGSLLGSIRQESFAGRPTDVDLGIIETKADVFLKDLNEMDKTGISRIDKFYDDENLLTRVQILLLGELIDVSIFRPHISNNVRYWKGEYDENSKSIDKYIYIEHKNLISLTNCQLYGFNYLSPSNPERYLENKFGANWRIPNKKQFMWNKKI